MYKNNTQIYELWFVNWIIWETYMFWGSSAIAFKTKLKGLSKF